MLPSSEPGHLWLPPRVPWCATTYQPAAPVLILQTCRCCHHHHHSLLYSSLFLVVVIIIIPACTLPHPCRCCCFSHHRSLTSPLHQSHECELEIVLKEVASYNVPMAILPFSTRIPDGKLYFHFSQVLCINHIFVSVIFLMMGSSHWSSKTLAGLIGFQPLQTKSSLQEPRQENTWLAEEVVGGKTFYWSR